MPDPSGRAGTLGWPSSSTTCGLQSGLSSPHHSAHSPAPHLGARGPPPPQASAGLGPPHGTMWSQPKFSTPQLRFPTHPCPQWLLGSAQSWPEKVGNC